MRTILDEAREIIWGDREKTYGNPAFNLETIAEFWRIWLERRHNVLVALQPEDVAYMMVLLKTARLLNSPDHHDSMVDLCGYVGLLDRVQHPENEPGMVPAPVESTPIRRQTPYDPLGQHDAGCQFKYGGACGCSYRTTKGVNTAAERELDGKHGRIGT